MQEAEIDFIYALVEVKSKIKFYIGRTIEPKRRLREHRYGARTYKPGDEDKYQYANALNAAGLKWTMEILMECGPDTEHYEDFFVNKYRLLGEPLQNMKAGDSEPWMGREYSSPQEFVKTRDKLIREREERKLLNDAAPKARKESNVELTRFVDDVKKGTVSPGLQAILDRRKKR